MTNKGDATQCDISKLFIELQYHSVALRVLTPITKCHADWWKFFSATYPVSDSPTLFPILHGSAV